MENSESVRIHPRGVRRWILRTRGGRALKATVQPAFAASLIAVLTIAIVGCSPGHTSTVPVTSSTHEKAGCNIYMSKARTTECVNNTNGGWDPSTPIIGLVEISPLSSSTGIFDSSFDYESFLLISAAVGPGYDMYTGTGSKSTDPGAYGSQVAMTKHGLPSGNCNGSFKSVGDVVGLANIDGITSQRLVADINTIFAYGGYKVVGGNKVFMSPTIVGWMYKDNAGAYWFQKDAAISWQFQLQVGFNLAQWVQLQAGVAINGQQPNPVFMGGTLPTEAPHTVDGQCWDGGAVFFPDGIS